MCTETYPDFATLLTTFGLDTVQPQIKHLYFHLHTATRLHQLYEGALQPCLHMLGCGVDAFDENYGHILAATETGEMWELGTTMTLDFPGASACLPYPHAKPRIPGYYSNPDASSIHAFR